MTTRKRTEIEKKQYKQKEMLRKLLTRIDDLQMVRHDQDHSR